MARKIQFRRGIAATWTSTNPTLAIGEFGLETDTGRGKVGTGVTAWVSLPYLDAGAVAHIADTVAAHTAGAIAFTPAGTIAATDLQAAVVEVATDAAAATATVAGDLSTLSSATSDALALKAALASPALTGTPTAPTAVTATSTTQLATTAFVQQERAAQAATDSSRYVALPLASALVEPYIIPHRGSSLLYPENTLNGFVATAAQRPAIMEGGDVRVLADGALAVYHDSTLDDKTTSTGTAELRTSLDWKSVVIDASTWWGTNGGTPAPLFFPEVLAAIGGQAVLSVETKLPESVAPTLAVIQRAGLGPSIIHNSFTLADCLTFAAAGIASCFNGTVAQITSAAASLNSGGVRYAAFTDWSTASDAAIQALVALGVTNNFKVWVGTIQRHKDYARLRALGVVGFYSDDPIYLDGAQGDFRYRRTTDPWAASNRFYHGHQAGNEGPELLNRGTFSGGWWTPGTAPVVSFALMGWGSPVANPAAHTIGCRIRYDALGSDATRWGALLVGSPDDAPSVSQNQSYENGYLCMLRANGQMVVFRILAGAAVSLGTLSTTAPTAGQEVPITVQITSTQVIFTRTDTASTLTVNDSTASLRTGGYFHAGRNSNGGNTLFNCSFSAFTVS